MPIAPPPTPENPLTIAFACAGRRVELIQAFRAAARELGLPLRIVGTDGTPTAPTMSVVDLPMIVPPIADQDYIPATLRAVREHDVRMLVPTIDTDLLLLAQHREEFAAAGCQVLVAEPRVITICRDKGETFKFLQQSGFDCPRTWAPAELTERKGLQYPLFIKPRSGSAGIWTHKLDDQIDLDYHLSKIRDPLVQEFVAGTEHTLDVYVGLTGEPRCVVPRVRWAVRGGEVVKGVVVKDHEVMEAGRAVVAALGDSPRGLMTLQCIVTPDRRIRFIEINPRFGGGAPLGIAAGADYPRWLLQELLGQTPDVTFDGFRHGMCMLRYDWSVFVPLEADCRPALHPPHRPAPDFA